MTWTIQQRSEVGGLAAITGGEGPNVLFLHGVGLRAEAWAAQLKGLPASFTAPDMPGHGESAFERPELGMDDYAEAALSVLCEIDGPTLVVGHSMGAMLATELAVRAPARVCAVAALNAVFERTDKAAAAVQARASALDGQTAPDPSSTLKRWFGDARTPERTACETWLNAVDPTAYKCAYTAFAHSQIPHRSRLSALQCPALFITGSEEPNSTPAMSRAMADVAPQGRALIVDGAAHMMPMTHAAEVNAALRGLLTEVFP